MSRINSARRLTLIVATWLGFGAVSASAADGASGQPSLHLLSPARKPPGVPANYVLTHNGFFHPSCVVSLDSGELVGADLVIRGTDGAEHRRFAPCAHERYGTDGRAHAADAPVRAPVHAPVHAPPVQVLYDGYIVDYAYWGDLPNGPTLTTDWTVPQAPKNVADQDIAFFNAILTTAGGGDILQPVLDFNGNSLNHWAIESEHCCLSGNDMQTTAVAVNVGDQIRGTVTGSNCASSGVCQNWTVTTADLTTGKSTTLNTTAAGGVPNGVSPASLESYGVSACDMFPASGKTVFTDNQLTSAAGTATLKYKLAILDGANAEVPRNCGYAGVIAGNDYTLIYGEVAVGGGGADGSSTAGSAGRGGASSGSAAGRGGGAGAGTSGSGGTTSSTGGTLDHGGSAVGGTGASGGSAETNRAGQTGAGGAGSGGAIGAGGVAGARGDTTAGAGASAIAAGASQSNDGAAGSDSGCSCKLSRGASAASRAASSLGFLLTGLSLAITRRQRLRRAARAA